MMASINSSLTSSISNRNEPTSLNTSSCVFASLFKINSLSYKVCTVAIYSPPLVKERATLLYNYSMSLNRGIPHGPIFQGIHRRNARYLSDLSFHQVHLFFQSFFHFLLFSFFRFLEILLLYFLF